jgi:stage II sporulation protein AA (anti-sigma F factor antagonist)
MQSLSLSLEISDRSSFPHGRERLRTRHIRPQKVGGEMKLIKEIRDNVAILTLKGEFDSFVCTPFMEEVKALFKNNIKFLMVDMRLILFINSTAIGTLVKIHKETKKEGGRLVLCRPSKFVQGVLESLGLNAVFSMSDDLDKTLEELGAASDGTDVGGDNSVILHLAGGKDKVIGKIAALEEEGLTIILPDTKEKLEAGAECKVKFRIPLFMKGKYFEAGVKINNVGEVGNQTQLKCTFENIKDDERKSISQFVEEMKFLRSEARKNK